MTGAVDRFMIRQEREGEVCSPSSSLLNGTGYLAMFPHHGGRW